MKTTKRYVTYILAAMMSAAAVFTAGCASAASETGADVSGGSVNSAVEFTDALGRTVKVTSADRTASLLGSFSEVWMLAGGSLAASVDEAWENYDLGLTDDTVNLGAIHEPNVELLIASQPDFVIASSNIAPDVEIKSTLENAGITVAYFDVNNFDDYLNMLKVCTDITGRADLYQQNGENVRSEIEKAKSRVTSGDIKVLLMRASSASVKAKKSEGTVAGEMLKDLGCINIADSDSSLLEDLSLEAIVKADPDYIFVTVQGSNTEAALKNVDSLLKDNAVWSSLSAVKNNRYYVLDKSLYHQKPNARWGEAYTKLADILYP